MTVPAQLPSVDQFDESSSNFFGTNRGGPQWNDFDEDDELPMGRNTMKALSKEIVSTKGQSPSKGGGVGASGFGGIENSYRVQQPPLPPPMGYAAGLGAVPPPGGTGYPGFKIALQQPSGGLKPSSQAPSAGAAGGGGGGAGGGGGGGGGGWQISDDMMKQPWGAHTPHATRHTRLLLLSANSASLQPPSSAVRYLTLPISLFSCSPGAPAGSVLRQLNSQAPRR